MAVTKARENQLEQIETAIQRLLDERDEYITQFTRLVAYGRARDMRDTHSHLANIERYLATLHRLKAEIEKGGA